MRSSNSKSKGDKSGVTCPFCRADWPEIPSPPPLHSNKNGKRGGSSSSSNALSSAGSFSQGGGGVASSLATLRCYSCKISIQSIFYRCIKCVSPVVNLCRRCFDSNALSSNTTHHAHNSYHPFVTSPAAAYPPQYSPAIPTSHRSGSHQFLQGLQTREITPADYSLLLNLDGNVPIQRHLVSISFLSLLYPHSLTFIPFHCFFLALGEFT
jgi:hypothetical protein